MRTLPVGDPVVPIEVASGARMWFATSNKAVRSVMGDRRFGRRLAESAVPRFVGPDHTSVVGSMFNADDDDHIRIRRIIAPAFVRSAFEPLEAEMRAACSELAASVRGAERADLIDEYCEPASRWFTGAFLRLAETRQAEIETAVRTQTVLAGDPVAVQQATAELTELAARTLADVADADRPDPIARLRRAERGGDLLAEEAIGTTDMLQTFTTGALIPPLGVGTMRVLLDERLRADCAADRSLWPQVAAEVFRYGNNALVEYPRVATEDVELEGVLVRAGEAVVTSALAAGWDPSAVQNPATFEIGRPNDASLPFGLGRRACPARGISHAALALGLETLFTELPRARLISHPGDSIPLDSTCPSHVWVRA